MCAGKDLNLRSPKATDLQSVVIDHSTTDAGPVIIHNGDIKTIPNQKFFN